MIAKVWELAGLMVDEKDKKGRENYANQNDRYGVGLDTDSIVKELVSAYSTKRKNTKKSRQNLAGSRRSGKV